MIVMVFGDQIIIGKDFYDRILRFLFCFSLDWEDLSNVNDHADHIFKHSEVRQQ